MYLYWALAVIISLLLCISLFSYTQSQMMELSDLWFFLFFLIPFFYLLKCKLAGSETGGVGSAKARLPPGTSGLPLFGETLSYVLKVRKGAQLEFVTERMTKYSSKIFRTSLMGEKVAVIPGAEGNKFLFSNEGKLVQVWHPSQVRTFFPLSHNAPAGVHGRKTRTYLVPRILKINGLQYCIGIMDKVMKQHLETFWTSNIKDDDDDQVIIKGAEMAKRYSLAMGCNIFLGIENLGEIERLLQGLEDIEAAFTALPINLPGTAWNRGIRASKAMRSRFEAMVRAKKAEISEGGDNTLNKDLIADMILAKDENGESMKEEDIASDLLGFLVGGYLTPQMNITTVLKALAEFPDVYDSVLKEQREIANSKESRDGLTWEDFEKMKYTWNVVREVMRLYTLSLGGFKEAMTDITYEGYTIPKGWKIYWLTQFTHLNREYFPDPEEFDPSRWDGEAPVPYTFVPFGAGSRICPGHVFAKLEILTFMHYVVTKFRWEKVNPDEKIIFSSFPYPAEGLPIRLYRHKG